MMPVVDVKDGGVYLRLHGAGQGCGAAEFTLKQGNRKDRSRTGDELIVDD